MRSTLRVSLGGYSDRRRRLRQGEPVQVAGRDCVVIQEYGFRGFAFMTG